MILSHRSFTEIEKESQCFNEKFENYDTCFQVFLDHSKDYSNIAQHDEIHLAFL